MTVGAVVLAAGGGSRFAGDVHKLRAPLQGRPVLAWVLDEVTAAGFNEVLVVTGADDLDDVIEGADDGRLRVVRNQDWARGQATSLALAVAEAERAGHRAIVVGLGDQPMVPAAAWRTVGATAGPVVTASFDGHRRPPVKLERTVWPLLPAEGDEGARSLMRARPDLVHAVPCRGNPVDIDTVEDLARWS
jgi:molybdenum cofactor cytidylyltransferase